MDQVVPFRRMAYSPFRSTRSPGASATHWPPQDGRGRRGRRRSGRRREGASRRLRRQAHRENDDVELLECAAISSSFSSVRCRRAIATISSWGLCREAGRGGAPRRGRRVRAREKDPRGRRLFAPADLTGEKTGGDHAIPAREDSAREQRDAFSPAPSRRTGRLGRGCVGGRLQACGAPSISAG
jgi:hypothetical protein